MLAYAACQVFKKKEGHDPFEVIEHAAKLGEHAKGRMRDLSTISLEELVRNLRAIEPSIA